MVQAYLVNMFFIAWPSWLIAFCFMPKKQFPMQHTNFQGPFGSREDDFLSFYQPSWSCELDHLIKLAFPHPMEVPHKIWLQYAMQFLRKRNLKMLNLSDLGPKSMNDLDL